MMGLFLKNTNDPVKAREPRFVNDQYVVFDDSQVGVKQYYVMEDDYQEVQKFEEDKAKTSSGGFSLTLSAWRRR